MLGKSAIAGFFALAALSVAADNAKVLNIGGSMDLGQEGTPVPGWSLNVFRFELEKAAANPKLAITTVAEKGGVDGLCLKVPYVDGMHGYQLTSNDMFIDRDGEVEISFDYKIGKPVDNAKPNIKCGVDFRCFGDENVKVAKPDHPRYPVLKGFEFKPTAEWQHLSKKFKVIKWHNCYTIWINVGTADDGTINAPLYLDNFSIKLLGSSEGSKDEAAVIPAKSVPYYFGGDAAKFKVKALLDSKKEEEDVKLDIAADYDSSLWKSVKLSLRKTGEQKLNKLGIYEGEVEFPADKFGSFHCTVAKEGVALPTLGDFSILHPTVEHKRFSPGWTIGCNGTELVAPHTKNADHFKWVMLKPGSSMDANFEAMQLAGMQTVRHWGNWLDIEPEQDKFRSDLTNIAMDGYKRHNLEPIFTLVGSLFYCKDDGEMAGFPKFLYKYRTQHYESRFSKPGEIAEYVILPPMDIYGAYLDFCLKTWGKDVHIWELFNEPGLGPFPAEKYLGYLKYTYKEIKSRDKADLLLGNGVTGDFGMNVIGWCDQLNKADPDYPNYLDGVAFHPYNSATDYQNGIYGLYAKCVKDISDTLKVKKPLWNTECYYLIPPKSKQIQFYVNQSISTADTTQRHYLDGMLNGVKNSSSIHHESFIKRAAPTTGTKPFSEMGSATNALSYMLKDMEKLEPVKLSKFMRAGIFTDASGDKATGFVYALQPAGSSILPADNKSFLGLFGSKVKIMDLYGNEFADTSRIPLGYAPCFIQGSTKDVKSFFEKSKFVPNESCRILARKFRDEIHFNALNSAGVPGTVEVAFQPESGLPKTQFVFADGADDNTLSLGSAKCAKLDGVGFTVLVNGENGGDGKIVELPPVKCFDIVGKEADAKEITLSRGSKAKVWSEGGALHVKANVKDSAIIAAKGSSLWEGDALEIFIDKKPFNQLERDVILGSMPLPCLQYVFAAVPSESGVSAVGMDRQDSKFKTAATCKQSKTADGYCVEGVIPWTEILKNSKGNFIGLDLEIDHKDAKDNVKESLSGKDGNSFNSRLHYPLFKLDESASVDANGKGTVRNASMQSGSWGDPDVWYVNAQGKGATSTLTDAAGLSGGKAMVFNASRQAPEGSLVLQQQLARPEWAKGAKVDALVKMEGVNANATPFNSYWPQGFALTFGHADYGRLQRRQLTGDCPWTLVQFYSEIPQTEKNPTLSVGLRDATGKLSVACVNVEFIP